MPSSFGTTHQLKATQCVDMHCRVAKRLDNKVKVRNGSDLGGESFTTNH